MGEVRMHPVRDGVLLFALSIIFLNLNVVSILYVAPLLLYAIRYGERPAEGLIAISFLAVALYDVFSMRSVLTDRSGIAFLLIGMYFPLSLSAAGIVWLRLRGEGRLLRRLFLTLLPSLAVLMLYAVFIFTDRALPGELHEAYRNAFAALLGPVLSLVLPGVDLMLVIDIILIASLSLTIPVLFAGICASCFIYEAARHSRESDWEDKVMLIAFPPDAIWGFIVSWALVLVLRFVSAPLLLEIAVMNMAGVWTIVYAIQGFSVIVARVRRHHRALSSMTLLVVIIAIGLLVPGINFIVLIGVPALGVLETFFVLKKIGEYYEDHS